MLNPLLLWFLPLALVPIILHLLTLYRVRTVELSTFRFLMDSYLHQRRRLRLLEWLLMFLRTAFIVLIVLMLSRPVVHGMGQLFGGESGRDVVIVMDASATTSLRRDGTSAMDRARATANHVASLLDEDDHLTLVRAGHQPQVLARGFVSQLEAVGREIDAIEPDVAPADLPAALAEVVAAPRHGPRVIYLLTDAQRRTLERLNDHSVIHQLAGEDDRLVVMNFGPDEPVQNLAVVGDPPHALRSVVGLPVLLQATVAAAGYDQAVDTRLSVVIEDEVATQLSLTVQPGQTVTRQIAVTPEEPGVLRGRFELPGDGFPDDDTYLFTLNVEPHIRVLLVAPPEGDTRVEQDPRFYVGAALRAPGRVADDFGGTEQRISQALEIEEVAEDQLSRLHLQNADVVIAADIEISERIGSMLHDYVSDGGGLMVVPGPRPDIYDYNENLLGATLHEDRAVAYRGARGDIDDEGTFAAIGSLDRSHPIMGAFADDDDDADYFSTVRLYRHFPMVLASSSGGYPRVLMQLDSDTPLLVEHRIGAGRMLLAGFAATPTWSDLPLKPEFVPIMLRGVAHLRREAEITTPSAVRPYDPAAIRLSRDYLGGSVEMIDPRGHPHTVTLHQTDRRLIGAAEQTGRKGYYTFRVTPPAGMSDGRREAGFAVNLALEDAAFDTLEGDELEAVFAPAELVHLRTTPEDPMLAQQLDQRREIWRTLIWLMFALIAVEFILSTLRGGSAAGGEGPAGSGGLRQRVSRRLDRALGIDRDTVTSTRD